MSTLDDDLLELQARADQLARDDARRIEARQLLGDAKRALSKAQTCARQAKALLDSAPEDPERLTLGTRIVRA
jgi:hypothetical protein